MDFQTFPTVVEAYRLDRYDNTVFDTIEQASSVVEAYRLDRYDNSTVTVTTVKILL